MTRYARATSDRREPEERRVNKHALALPHRNTRLIITSVAETAWDF